MRGIEVILFEPYLTEIRAWFEVPKRYYKRNKEMVEAVKLVAQLEGVFLDPVYNGKAMVGLIDMIKTEQIPKDDNILAAIPVCR